MIQKFDKNSIQDSLAKLNDWQLVCENNIDKIIKVYRFKNYVKTVEYCNKVAELAETLNHHPSILLEWGKVKLTWWSHDVKGLSERDFNAAIKSDNLYLK